jgi:4'-phosphopantetheinyl transferase EntD
MDPAPFARGSAACDDHAPAGCAFPIGLVEWGTLQNAGDIAGRQRPMIELLLPHEAAAVDVRGDDPQAGLFAEEAAQIHGAVESRLREFTTGRWCARGALRKLHLPPMPILRGVMHEPVWPAGVVGSITHCAGYRAAAVAMRSNVITIGIDAEVHRPLAPGILQQVAVAQEQDWLAKAPVGIHWDRVLFSVKESVFKAWFPLTKSWLDFEQIIVTFQPADGTFHAQLLLPPTADGCLHLRFLRGRFLVREGFVLTAIAVTRHAGAV